MQIVLDGDTLALERELLVVLTHFRPVHNIPEGGHIIRLAVLVPGFTREEWTHKKEWG